MEEAGGPLLAMRSVGTAIAGLLPADTACQIARVAERLGIADCSDALAEVANAVTRQTSPQPGSQERRNRGHQAG